MKLEGLDSFFTPRGVAVVGASVEPGKIGREILLSLLRSGYKGKVYPVNPKYDNVEGLKCYSSVLEVPDPVDLAVLAIPSRLVPRVVEECGLRGIRSVVVVSGGFKEVGDQGLTLEEEMLRRARRHGVRVVGPNCIGVFDGHSRIDTFFQSYDRMIRPPPGNVAFLTQSGTYGCTMLEWLAEEGIGVSKFVSYGNMADVDEAEFLEYLGADDKTGIIAFYMESIKSGRRFVEVAKEVTRVKPVIVFKAGKTRHGVSAAKSHTGNIAGDYRIVRGALRQAGVVAVGSIVELLDAVKAFALMPPPRGDRIAMVTNGAGPCVVAADLIDEIGLNLAHYSDDTVKRLRNNLPSYAIPGNPVDLTGSATSQDFMTAGRILLEDENVDLVMFFFVFQDTPLEDRIVEELPRLKKYGKPIVAVAAGGPYTRRQCRRLAENRIPVYETPERAVKAIHNVIEYYSRRKGFVRGCPA